MVNLRTHLDNSPVQINLKGLRVGLLYWHQYEEVSAGLATLFQYMGIETKGIHVSERLPNELDVVIARGPYGSLVPLANQLLTRPLCERPAFVYMMAEQLPNPHYPEWLRSGVGLALSRLERLSHYEKAAGEWVSRPQYPSLFRKGTRFKYYGDLLWLRSTGVLSLLTLSSRWSAETLRAKGFDPLVLPLSYPSNQPVDFKQERDVPVLWLGKTGSERRRRVLKRVREDLRKRGIDLLIIDGVENPFIFGKKRDELLQRTKVVLNVLRCWWDDNSLRYLLAMPKGALVVTEPTLPHTSFESGIHLVDAPIEQLAEKISYYVSHEAERLQIST